MSPCAARLQIAGGSRCLRSDSRAANSFLCRVLQIAVADQPEITLIRCKYIPSRSEARTQQRAGQRAEQAHLSPAHDP